MNVTLPKQRIKNVFDDTVKTVRNGKTPNISKAMIKQGYSKSSAKALKVTQSVTWQKLLAQIDDDLLLAGLYDIALDNKDKRTKIVAIQELFKLKDKYPDKKLRLGALDEQNEVFD